MQSAEGEHELPQHAEHAGDDEDDPGADLVDERAADEGDDDVGEGVDGVEQVELGLAQRLAVCVLVVVLDVLLESLGGRARTLGLSKAYS